MRAGAVLLPVELRDGGGEQPLRTPGTGGEPGLWLVRAETFKAAVARLAPVVLDGSEKQRAAAFTRARDRDTYLAGHVALRLLLGARLGVPPAEVPLERLPCPMCKGPHGRPVVRGGAVHFSLSRSEGLCLLACAPAPVGVDVEAVPEYAVAEEVGACLHPWERAELSALRPADRPAAFARVWARKEACLKGLGVGLGRALSLDYVGAASGAVAAVRGWTVGDVAVDDGYAAAVAVR
ncbi:4'-phosphopantetheinyl transferase family protein, partial [Streptomyces thermovulgaris]